ncbi:MAG: hypothetical protein ACXVB9_15685 [Bdellovibrionota bacterium]
MYSGGTLRRITPQLPRIAVIFLLTELPIALADSAPPLAGASTEIAFTCTDSTGNVLGCTNLPASCSEWYPSCVKRTQNGTKGIPGNCSSATFTLVKYVGAPQVSADAADAAQSSGPSLAASPSPSMPEFAQTSSLPAPNMSPVVIAPPPVATPTAAALPGVPNAASFYQAALSLAASASRPAGPAKEAVLGATLNFSDPWMDYVSHDSRKELVTRLKGDPKLRDEIRAKINASPADPNDLNAQEKIEYFRQALAEAEFISHRGSLDALTPLNTQETFSANGNEEIRRLVASMRDADDGEAPLFPRVHRALWRQLANGNIHLRKPTKAQ